MQLLFCPEVIVNQLIRRFETLDLFELLSSQFLMRAHIHLGNLTLILCILAHHFEVNVSSTQWTSGNYSSLEIMLDIPNGISLFKPVKSKTFTF